jgi:predicted permease
MLHAFRRALAFIRRNRLDAELAEEIRLHLELRRQQLIENGVDPREADYEARRRFGNVTAVREETFAMWGSPSLDTMTHDVRYGLRMIAKSRGVSAVAIVSLAVGISVSTLLFSFANSFLFRPLHAATPAELMQVFTSDSDGGLYGGSSYLDYEAYRDSAAVFSGLLASTRAQATLSDAERSDVLQGLLVSGNYFNVLGLQPSRGRFFLAEEARTPGADPVVVVSHDAWWRRFGSDPQIVGRVLRLNGYAFTVIGVGPPRFTGTSIEYAADFFAPVTMQRAISPGSEMLPNRSARIFNMFGRLKRGVSIQAAEVSLRVVGAQLLLQYPDEWRDRSGRARLVSVLPERKARFVGAAPGATAWLFSSVMAGVVVLLGIACLNVATVLLARATTRRKEIAVRLALGASRRRVVQQLLTECALLAAAGGALGLLMAQWLAALVARFRPDEAPPFDLSLDYRVLVFSVAASLLTVVLFGLAPALQTTRPDVNAELKDTARPLHVRRLRVRLRDGLVIVQVALSVALLIGAALLFRSFHVGRTGDPGFRRDGVLSVDIDLSTMTNVSGTRARFYREAVASMSQTPGVERAALAALVPLNGSNITEAIEISEGGGRRSVVLDINVVGAGYFALMDVPLMRGREFGAADRENMPTVAIVNDTMARQFWNGDAIGHVLMEKEGPVEVVGVVGDVRHRSFGERPRPMVYFCADQRSYRRMTLHVRTGGPPAAVAREMQRALHEIDPAAGVSRPYRMSEYIDRVTMPQRLGALAAAATGVVELALAVMALYGVIAYATSQRTREIGLRMALGAPAGAVTHLIMRDGLRLTLAGLVLGFAIALAAGPLIASLLIGVGAADPVSFTAAAVLMLAVAAVASYLPARRAMRVDPSVALRTE